MILLLRSDSQEVHCALWEDNREVASKRWPAGRELSGQLLKVVEELLEQKGQEFSDLEGIVVYSGPGSYTGLRIGISVANALGYSLSVPVIGAGGESWEQEGLKALTGAGGFVPVVPTYGGVVFTTQPKK